MPLMTREGFLEHARDVLFGEGSECLYEMLSEYAGEVAQFGDAGPGTGLMLRKEIERHNKIAATYERLTGTRVQRATMPAIR